MHLEACKQSFYVLSAECLGQFIDGFAVVLRVSRDRLFDGTSGLSSYFVNASIESARYNSTLFNVDAWTLQMPKSQLYYRTSGIYMTSAFTQLFPESHRCNAIRTAHVNDLLEQCKVQSMIAQDVIHCECLIVRDEPMETLCHADVVHLVLAIVHRDQ